MRGYVRGHAATLNVDYSKLFVDVSVMSYVLIYVGVCAGTNENAGNHVTDEKDGYGAEKWIVWFWMASFFSFHVFIVS